MPEAVPPAGQRELSVRARKHLLLRYAADRRTLAYLAFTVALSVVQWNLPHLVWPLYALGLFMGVTTAVISHNHNHLGIWRSRTANLLTNYVLALYYGHPAVAWIPTHNKTHHSLNNRPGDTSRSPKGFRRNHLLALLVYPTLTGAEQMREVRAYLASLWRKDKRAFFRALSEYIVFGVAMAALLLLDWKKALLFFVIPQQFALFVIQVFNYVQHVEANEHSAWNHSRNFVSPVLNALLFNNGFHTVHHDKPGVHWSQTPKLHESAKQHIHPSLLQKSWWGYMVETFLLRPLSAPAALPHLE